MSTPGFPCFTCLICLLFTFQCKQNLAPHVPSLLKAQVYFQSLNWPNSPWNPGCRLSPRPLLLPQTLFLKPYSDQGPGTLPWSNWWMQLMHTCVYLSRIAFDVLITYTSTAVAHVLDSIIWSLLINFPSIKWTLKYENICVNTRSYLINIRFLQAFTLLRFDWLLRNLLFHRILHTQCMHLVNE